METIEINQMPAMAPLGLKILRKKFTTATGPIAARQLLMEGVTFDQAAVERYHRVCGFATKGPVAASYPQIPATPLLMALLSDPEFPYSALGMIHLDHAIEQSQVLIVGQPYQLSCGITTSESTERGVEMKVMCRYHQGEEQVWRSEATMLFPQAPKKSKPKGVLKPLPSGTDAPSWHLSKDLGRRYALASGDFNPIHLSRLTALPFGFKRPIIHGLWTMARTLASFPQGDQVQLRVAFKRPIPLPSEVCLRHLANPTSGFGEQGDGLAIVSSHTLHMLGEIVL